MDTVYLVGSEDVRRAASDMQAAAADMLRAASEISVAVEALRQMLYEYQAAGE